MPETLKVWGAGVFSDPNGEEWLIWATNGGCFRWRQGTRPVRIRLHGARMDRPVTFTQGFDKLVMFRGEDVPELEMADLNAGFRRVAHADPGDGTHPIPFAARGTLFKNRFMIPHGRDQLAVSDVLDYTVYQPVTEAFRINQGEADQIVTVLPLGTQTVLVAKAHTIYLVSNIVADADGNFLDAQCDKLTSEWGVVAAQSLVQCVNDALALSARGVVSFRFNEQMKLQGIDLPLSAPIEDLIQRIHWGAANGACGAYWDNAYYLAVPFDHATYNNVILRYDFYQQAWTGFDDGSAVDVVDFVKLQYGGKERLFFVDSKGWLNLVEEGRGEDQQTDGQCAAIQTDLTTRGYGGRDPDPKRFCRLSWALRTWAPTYTLGARSEERTSGVTRTRTRTRAKYDIFAQPDYDTTNTNHDAELPGRQDRSVIIPADGLDLGDGLALETMEPKPERFDPRLGGRICQGTLAAVGHVEVTGVAAGWRDGPGARKET